MAHHAARGNAAERTERFYNDGFCAEVCCGVGRRYAGRACADDKHVGFDDRKLVGVFCISHAYSSQNLLTVGSL